VVWGARGARARAPDVASRCRHGLGLMVQDEGESYIGLLRCWMKRKATQDCPVFRATWSCYSVAPSGQVGVPGSGEQGTSSRVEVHRCVKRALKSPKSAQ
jgi:hypothetical protein